MNSDRNFRKKVLKHWPQMPAKSITDTDSKILSRQILELLKQKNAIIVAHYYTDPAIQKLAELSGGFIGDSLEMARFGAEHQASTLLVAGVRFMGESAKILSPEKRVLMPTLAAECSLDIGCEPEEFKEFCKKHPERTIVVYANTSAEVKALADWTVTSSIAVEVVKHLGNQGKKIIWAPDRYLGNYIMRNTGVDMLIWDACCVVHQEFDVESIRQQKNSHPDAELLVHPESQPGVIELADVIGSTSQLLKASQQSQSQKFIVATENGILYKMQQACPDKEFIMAATAPANEDFACQTSCPWMKMNNLQNIYETLRDQTNEIKLSDQIIAKALVPLQRMLQFNQKR
ncbi:MAG: quinolinate synthase NadA [Erysipelotrichia bacterium]|nr:quinolinate synthase NadA [Erysipelotrichia bacterium]